MAILFIENEYIHEKLFCSIISNRLSGTNHETNKPFSASNLETTPTVLEEKSVPWLEHQAERGNEYCSAVYRALQASCGIQTSMSCKGNCFFDTLKTENLHHY